MSNPPVKLKIDGRKLSHEQSEYIRIQAVKAVRIDHSSAEDVIKTFGLHRANIYKWLKKYDQFGLDALKSKKARGPQPKLTPLQKHQLKKLILKNPLQLKLDFEYALWTIAMVKELIWKKFKVNYSTSHVHNILKAIGYSNQRPIERAYQQDPVKVDKWLTKEYKAIKAEAVRQDRTIYFGDEAGFHETASYGKTWAPKGETPIIKSTGARTKVNCISAISPKGKLHFMLYEHNFNASVFIDFLKKLLYNQKKKITLIVDGHNSHTTKAIKDYVASTKGKLKIYLLPPYSPELNPDELVWNNAKQKAAKKKYSRAGMSYKEMVTKIIEDIQRNISLLKSFFCEPNVAYAI